MPYLRPRAYFAFSRIALPLIFSLASVPLRAQTRDFAILYHERVQEISFVEGRERAQAAGATQPSAPSLSFVAFGRRFDVDLRRNDRLTSTLDAEARARLSGVDIYLGEVRNAPRSWARLTRYRDQWTGVISDGADLYAIEPYSSAAPYLALPSDADGNDPIIYSWKDAVGPVVDEIGPVVSGPGAPASPRATPLALTAASGELVDVGLVGDTPFGQQPHGMSPEAAMISMANVADGIFVTQVGVHLNVAQIESFANSPEPFDSTDPSTLLSELAAHKAATTTLAGQGLVHLFTGRDFHGSAVVGIAYLASVCSGSHAAALTKVTDLGSGGLIAAHEIGHNFGAPHDGAPGSACESTSFDYLMSPTLNGSDKFSMCSIQQMQPVIASASCLRPLPPSDISLRPVTTPTRLLLGTNYSFDLAIDSHGGDAFDISANAVGDGLRVDSVSYMHCGSSSPPGCAATSLSDGQSMSLAVSATAERVGPASIDVYVQSINDSNPLNNSYHLDVNVLPTLTLAVDRTDVTPKYLYPHGTFDVTFEVSNHGSVPATQVVAHIDPDPGLSILGFSSPAGTCTEQPGQGNWICPIGVLAPGVPQRVTATVLDQSGELGLRSVLMLIDTAEVNYGAHLASASITVVATLADLSVSIDSAARQDPGVPKGERFDITVKGHNAGPDAASNVALQLRDLSGVLAIDKIDGAPCVPSSDTGFDCGFGTVAAGADFAVTFSSVAHLLGGGSVSAYVSSSAAEGNPSDNTDNAHLLIFDATPPQTTPSPSTTPQPTTTSSGGGGGGAIDWLSASLLALALTGRRRARRAQ